MLIGRLGTNTIATYAWRLAGGIVITVFFYWLRGDRMYSCGIKKRGIRAFACIIPIVVIFLVVMAVRIAKTPGITAKLFLCTLLVACEAGFCEEMMVRAVPLGNILWRQSSIKKIIGIGIYSSVIFGLLHIGNVAVTGDIAFSGMQAFVDIFAGLFFMAVYLRTGSAVPGIAAHALWDFMLMFNPENLAAGDFKPMHDMTGVVEEMAKMAGIGSDKMQTIFIVLMVLIIAVVGTFWTILTLILLRRSKREEIVQNFSRD